MELLEGADGAESIFSRLTELGGERLWRAEKGRGRIEERDWHDLLSSSSLSSLSRPAQLSN